MRLSPEEMTEIFESHGQREFARDLEGTMETVGLDPLWEFHPLGLRITERDSVRAVYQRQFEHIFPYVEKTVDRSRIFGDNSMALEVVVQLCFSDGQYHEANLVAILAFDQGVVTSERVYASGRLQELFSTALGDSIRGLPGVTDLNV